MASSGDALGEEEYESIGGSEDLQQAIENFDPQNQVRVPENKDPLTEEAQKAG